MKYCCRVEMGEHEEAFAGGHFHQHFCISFPYSLDIRSMLVFIKKIVFLFPNSHEIRSMLVFINTFEYLMILGRCWAQVGRNSFSGSSGLCRRGST